MVDLRKTVEIWLKLIWKWLDVCFFSLFIDDYWGHHTASNKNSGEHAQKLYHEPMHVISTGHSPETLLHTTSLRVCSSGSVGLDVSVGGRGSVSRNMFSNVIFYDHLRLSVLTRIVRRAIDFQLVFFYISPTLLRLYCFQTVIYVSVKKIL